MKSRVTDDVQRALDALPVSRAQWRALVLCLLLGITDGFDALVIGFVVPALSREFDVSVASLTPVTLAAVIGTVFGAMLLAPLADRFGRRPVILVGTAVFGVLTLAAAAAPSILALIVLRFVAGLALGAVPATLIAYGAELAPSRLRGTFVTIIGTGLAAGGFVGGFAAGFLIPAFGWRSLFIVGGVFPLILLVCALRLLPETAQYLAAVGRRAESQAALARFGHSGSIDVAGDSQEGIGEPTPEPSARFVRLFASGRAPITVVLWVLYVCQFIGAFFIFSWLPSVLTNAGVGEQTAMFATSLCTLGGMAGALLLGAAVDRLTVRYRLLVASYLIGGVSVVAASYLTGSTAALLAVLFLTGFGLIGTGTCMNAVAAGLYPAEIRATAVGWANGWGRVGSVLGPGIGGLLLALELSSRSIFQIAVAPALVCALCVVALGLRARQASPADFAPALQRGSLKDSGQTSAGPVV